MHPVLITGGAGFIGSCLVRQWLRHELDPVVNLDKLTYAGSLDALSPIRSNSRHRFIHGDIVDGELLARLFRDHQPRAVVHLAAETHVDRSIDGPAAFARTNVLGTCMLLDAALKYWRNLSADRRASFRFLHVSTDEVFGDLEDEGSFDETSPYHPHSPYSASKAAADHFVRAYHHTYGLPVMVTHCTNNYGPHQHPEKLFPLMTLRALAGLSLPVYGDGGQIRDWLYVADHCRALRRVLEAAKPGDTFNIGAHCEYTNLEIVHLICKTVDRLCPHLAHRPSTGQITFVADRPGHDRRYAINAGEILRRLGWRPRASFPSSLRTTVAWYIQNQHRLNANREGHHLVRRGLSQRTA